MTRRLYGAWGPSNWLWNRSRRSNQGLEALRAAERAPGAERSSERLVSTEEQNRIDRRRREGTDPVVRAQEQAVMAVDKKCEGRSEKDERNLRVSNYISVICDRSA